MVNLEVQKDIQTYKKLEALSNSEGGKTLIRNLRKDIVDDIDSLISHWNGSETELRSWTLKLKTDITMLRSLIRARSNKKLAIEAFDAMEKELEESVEIPHR